MPDDDMKRLEEFRNEGNGETQVTMAMLVVALVCLAIGLAIGSALTYGFAVRKYTQLLEERGPNAAIGGLEASKLREYALYLERKDMKAEAVGAYKEYLQKAAIDDETRAKVCYAAAGLAIDVERHEEALALLYRAEMLTQDEALKEDIGKKVVRSLEHLGRETDVKRELRERGAIERESDPETDTDATDEAETPE